MARAKEARFPRRGVWPPALTGPRPLRNQAPSAHAPIGWPSDELPDRIALSAGICRIPADPGGDLRASARGRLAQIGHGVAPDRSPPPPSEAGARQFGPRLSRHAARGARADRGRHVGEPRPHLRRRLLPRADHEGRPGHLRADGAIARDRPRRTLHRLRPPSRQLGACRLCRQAHGRAVHRRLSAPEQPLRRRSDAQNARGGVRGRASARTTSTARTLLKTAKQGGYPAFLADLRDDRGAAVPFFGAPARSTVFPALLARTTGLPLYAGAAFRRPNVHFVIRGARIPVPETNDREADAIVATAALQKQFEAFIREAPEQWMWAHRKWDEGRGGRYSEIFGIIPADQ